MLVSFTKLVSAGLCLFASFSLVTVNAKDFHHTRRMPSAGGPTVSHIPGDSTSCATYYLADFLTLAHLCHSHMPVSLKKNQTLCSILKFKKDVEILNCELSRTVCI